MPRTTARAATARTAGRGSASARWRSRASTAASPSSSSRFRAANQVMGPTKILVVDDEPDLELLIRQRFRRQVKDGRFDFVFAHNGVEALARLGEHPDVDLVLS